MTPLANFVFFLQATPARALVLAMLLSYVMCFAGLIFAYINYRKRKKQPPSGKDGEEKP